MGKLVFIAIVAAIGYGWLKGWMSAPPPQEEVVVDRLADQAARLAAERERIYEEQAAVARNWQPSAPAAPAATSWQFSERGAVSTRDEQCATARNNVNVTSDWMRQGGSVHEKGSGKRLSENESFDAAARNRQFIEDNFRGR